MTPNKILEKLDTEYMGVDFLIYFLGGFMICFMMDFFSRFYTYNKSQYLHSFVASIYFHDYYYYFKYRFLKIS